MPVIVSPAGRLVSKAARISKFGRQSSKPNRHISPDSADYVRRANLTDWLSPDAAYGGKMSAEIIMFIPRPNPNREKSLEQQANEIFTAAFQDTAPCEYVAPEKDPA